MYSMQMTGYMFRSAEYRRSLMESLGAAGESSGLLPPEAGEDETREDETEPPAQLPQVWPRLVRVRVRVRVWVRVRVRVRVRVLWCCMIIGIFH